MTLSKRPLNNPQALTLICDSQGEASNAETALLSLTITTETDSPSLVSPERDTEGALRLLLLSLVLWVAVYVGVGVLTASVPRQAMGLLSLGGRQISVLTLITAVALVVTTLWLIHAGVACHWPPWAVLVGAASCVAVHQLILTIAKPSIEEEVWTVTLFGITNVALIGATIFLGKLVGGFVERPSWLYPIALVLIAVDVWSVFFGPTREVAEEVVADPAAAEVAQRLMLWLPNLGAEDGGLAVQPAYGVGDFIVAALLLEVARRFGLRVGAGLLVMMAALLVASVAAIFTPHGVPALPFLVLAFLAVNLGRLQANRREMIICVVFIVTLFALLIFAINPLIAALWPGELP